MILRSRNVTNWVSGGLHDVCANRSHLRILESVEVGTQEFVESRDCYDEQKQEYEISKNLRYATLDKGYHVANRLVHSQEREDFYRGYDQNKYIYD